jgi:hypothetical protein
MASPTITARRMAPKRPPEIKTSVDILEVMIPQQLLHITAAAASTASGFISKVSSREKHEVS